MCWRHLPAGRFSGESVRINCLLGKQEIYLVILNVFDIYIFFELICCHDAFHAAHKKG